MTKLALIAPTKGRPQLYNRLKESFEATTAGCSELLPVLDKSETDWYQVVDPIVLQDPCNLVEKLNVGAAVALAQRFDYIGWVADDLVIRTKDFDKLIIEAFEQNPHINIIHCRDMLHNGKIANHWILRAEVIERVRCFVPHEFRHLWIDNFWTKVGNDTNSILYLESVVWEHLHYMGNQARFDDTYKIGNSPKGMKYGEEVFNKLTTGSEYENFLKMYNG